MHGTDEPVSPEHLQELRFLLDRLVRRMTRRSFATPLQMQMDVGNAMSLLNRTGHFPRRPLMLRALPDLLRELGSRKPDLFRYVTMLEETVVEIDQVLALPRKG